MKNYILTFAILFSAWNVRADFDTNITVATTIGADNTSLDNKNVLISGCTVTINGSHTFSNLFLTNNAIVTHSPATTTTNYFLSLVISNTLDIAVGSAIDVTGTGFQPGRTQGNTTNGASQGAAGGSYGGVGVSDAANPANAVYGDFRNPNELGSGSAADGCAGGGLVRVEAESLRVEGQIRANGVAARYNRGGSGGGIYIKVVLSVAGARSARGAAVNIGAGAEAVVDSR